MNNEEKRPPMPPFDPADANMITRHYLDHLLIEERLLDAVEADLTTEIFGKTFSSPIMMPAFSHLNKAGSDRKPMEEYAAAAKELGLLNWVGMGSNEDFGSIAAVGAPTVRIIKPYADHDKIFDQIEYAEAHGAVAVGIDIDHIFGNNGGYDVVVGETMGPVSTDDLYEYIHAAHVPFVIKGVLSATDAVKCADEGVSAILVSHHHGRMPFAIPPLMVLPDIIEALGADSDMKIFVDCGINDGRDAFKALALGADAVAVGRAMLPQLLEKGTDGVVEKVSQMNEELKMLMGFTGTATVSDFDPGVLWPM